MTETDAERFARARRAMIDSQLRVSGVNDDVSLAALARVAREDFVPAEVRAHAYIDRALPLGGGHFLGSPLFHGRMLSEAAPRPGDKVLVVSASGYLGALVAATGAEVETIAPGDVANLRGTGGKSIVLIDGAVEQWPETLTATLTHAGRVVTGLVERGVTRLASGRRFDGEVVLLPLIEIGIPVLSEFAAPRRWSF